MYYVLFLLFFTHSYSLFGHDISAKELKKIVGDEENSITQAILGNPERFNELIQAIAKTDVMLMRRVDKTILLQQDYVPHDLVLLDSLEWPTVNRAGHQLRSIALESLRQMSLDAKKEGVTLLISSCYRSYSYQKKTYEGWIERLGLSQAKRISAPPGSSQHQLGLAVDFGSINDSFTHSKAERWLNHNAHRYGWSLSFPEHYEHKTGYRHESWHYRYIGPSAIALQREFFNNLQHKMINFWHQHGDSYIK